MDSNQNKPCFNCQKALPENALYCPQCGQKDTDGKISIREFFSSFLDTVFNLDSKFFKTLFHIFIPAKLTIQYFQGKHKTYSHPLRLFFGLAVIHMAIVGYVANKNMVLDNSTLSQMKTKVSNQETFSLIDSFELQHDSLLAMENVSPIIDTLKSFMRHKGKLGVDTTSEMPILSYRLDSMKFSPIMVKTNDIAELSPDSIISKYKITDNFSKLMLNQQIKAQDNPKSVILFGIGNMIWMLFILLPATALFMKVLYIRRKFFFIEHLVLLYHWHAVSFVFASIYLLIYKSIPVGFVALVGLLIILFGYLSMKKFYKQNTWKTLLKFFLILSFYQTVLLFLVMVTSFISLMVF